MQKAPLMQIKEGSSARTKSTMLEKAIRELERMVAECIFEYFVIIMIFSCDYSLMIPKAY